MPWPKGKPCYPETRVKVSIAKEDKHLSIEKRVHPSERYKKQLGEKLIPVGYSKTWGG